MSTVGVGGGLLLERNANLDTLDQLLAAAGGGVGALAVVEGPPGIGKTALLRETRRRAGSLGFQVVRAKAGVLERDYPFGVARQLLSSVGVAWISSSDVPALGSVTEVSFQVLDDCFQSLATMARAKPVLTVVDDAQWADSQSLRLIGYLAARLDALPVLVVLGLRPAEAGEQSALLATVTSGATVIRPGPLSERAVATLVRNALHSEPEPRFVAACTRLTGGNPFLVGELLTTLADQNVLPSAENAERVRAINPESVARAVLVRLAQLVPEARRLAGALAVLGGAARVDLAAALAELGPDETLAAIGALRHASILGSGPRLEFLHPLLHGAVYAHLTPAERERGHLSAARILAEASGSPTELAPHLLAVRPAGDPWVAARLLGAGRRALAEGACDSAADYLRRCLAEPPATEDRAEVLVSLAEAEAALGDAQALAHLVQALELIPRPVSRAQVAQRLGRLLFLRGDFPLAGHVAQLALDDLADREPALRQALLADYLTAASCCPELRRGDDRGAMELLDEARAGRLPAEPRLSAQLVAALALSGAAPEQVGQLATLAMESIPAEDATSDMLAAGWVSGALVIVGHYDLAEVVAERAFSRAQRSGSVVARAISELSVAYVRWHQGLLGKAAAHGWRALEASPPGWDLLVGLAAPVVAMSEVARGELARARAALRMGAHLVAHRPEWAYLLWAEGCLAMAEGAPEKALSCLQAAGELDQRHGLGHPGALPWRPLAALAAAKCGRSDEAREMAEEALSQARTVGTARPLGLALTAAGQVVGGPEGVELLEEAVELLGSSPARLELAEALVALGTSLRQAGSRRAARTRLQEGLAVARDCGATPLALRAHEQLLVAGARPRKMVRGGAEALTAMERRVASLAAGGATNVEIAQNLVIGRRTVEAHLARVYAKLGVRSRRQLGPALGLGRGAGSTEASR
jgi:DNA-binding CsgD family transcriptional regulator